MKQHLILLLPVLLACTPASGDARQAEPSTGAARGAQRAVAASPAAGSAAMDSLRAAFVRAYQARDAAALAALYADSATLVGTSGVVVRGREAIRDGYHRSLGTLQDFAMEAEASAQEGALAYERGVYSQNIVAPGRAPQRVLGTYLLVARRGADGRWRIDSHTVSRAPARAAE
ncbi:MAG TPA: SgcJ/EcaC family oxidoreductase [Longimicrobium sp.]|uniref:YybH family protein n=1 Tax=Longimicrobium sp. TaxID=2029185 RepID=UPI002EDB722B